MDLKTRLFGEKCTKCNDNRTKQKSGICMDCQMLIDMANESIIDCPKCQTPMEKELINEVIIDNCINCHSIFIDADEIEEITDLSFDENGNLKIVLLTGMIKK